MRGVRAIEGENGRARSCARRRGNLDIVGGAVLRVGVDEERCVDDTEHRRTGDCFEHDGTERRDTQA